MARFQYGLRIVFTPLALEFQLGSLVDDQSGGVTEFHSTGGEVEMFVSDRFKFRGVEAVFFV